MAAKQKVAGEGNAQYETAYGRGNGHARIRQRLRHGVMEKIQTAPEAHLTPSGYPTDMHIQRIAPQLL